VVLKSGLCPCDDLVGPVDFLAEVS
jgi:hypothetical protein